ncbi:MAG: TlpA family protein disulfide reductase [Chloroflexi bacterium]|nr:TlpA family protein disulfide reductase [Chloroflexota bacterium]
MWIINKSKVWHCLCIMVAVISLGVACSASERPIRPTPSASPTASAAPAVSPPMQPPTVTTVPLATRTPLPAARSELLSSGSFAPDFHLNLLDGTGLRLSDLKGKVVVLNFWASWCVPCRQEMPAFERMWQEYKGQGVIFVGVALSDREKDARAFAEEVGVTYAVGLDATGQIGDAYRVIALPTTYFIDRQGYVARALTGAANEGALRVFLAGQLAVK